MTLKEKLRLAQIKQSRLAEECDCTEQYINLVLNGHRKSQRVVEVATVLLNDVLERDPGLRAYFDGKGGLNV
jgi:hypothetical protein